MDEPVFQPPQKITIVESIVSQIVEQIQRDKLKAGDRLPSERQLIEILHVSRSSVREALQGLIAMGLVESRPGQGWFVVDGRGRLVPDIDSLALADNLQREMHLHLIEARRAIESLIARLAAERSTPEGVSRLREHLAAYKKAPFGRAGGRHGVSPHNALHLALAEMTGNPFFVPVVDNLLRAVPQSLRERETAILKTAELRRVTEDELAMHEAIVTAVERKDGQAAYDAMDYHLDYERRLVLRIFGSVKEGTS